MTAELVLTLDIDDRIGAAVDEGLLERAAERAIAAEGLVGPVEMGLIITDDAHVRELNSTYRHIDEATDVLSFPLTPPGSTAFPVPPGFPRQLGDVVISFERAREQSADYGHSLARELAYLLVHGVLHLLGYDHETEPERLQMRGKEESALVELPRQSSPPARAGGIAGASCGAPFLRRMLDALAARGAGDTG